MSTAHGRRGIRLNTIRREPIPVTLHNSETGQDIHFEIRSTSAMSARDRKLVQNYLQALIDFEATPDADLHPSNYDDAETMMEELARIGTRNLDLGAFNSMSFADRMFLCIALMSAFSEEQDVAENARAQIQSARDVEGERPNSFQRLAGRVTKTSPTPLQSLDAHSADDHQIG